MAAPQDERIVVLRVWRHGSTTVCQATEVRDDAASPVPLAGEDAILSWLSDWLKDFTAPA